MSTRIDLVMTSLVAKPSAVRTASTTPTTRIRLDDRSPAAMRPPPNTVRTVPTARRIVHVSSRKITARIDDKIGTVPTITPVREAPRSMMALKKMPCTIPGRITPSRIGAQRSLLPPPGFLDRVIDEQPEEVTVGCIRHILVDTEAEALVALERLQTGEDFAALADELSTDTVSVGGLLANASTCMLPMARWVPEFAAAAAVAPLNELVGPVASEFGFHIIRVEDKIAPTREEFIADPVPFVDGGTISSFFTPWFNGEVRAADITVNELVGRWSSDGVGIAPPDA